MDKQRTWKLTLTQLNFYPKIFRCWDGLVTLGRLFGTSMAKSPFHSTFSVVDTQGYSKSNSNHIKYNMWMKIYRLHTYFHARTKSTSAKWLPNDHKRGPNDGVPRFIGVSYWNKDKHQLQTWLNPAGMDIQYILVAVTYKFKVVKHNTLNGWLPMH